MTKRISSSDYSRRSLESYLPHETGSLNYGLPNVDNYLNHMQSSSSLHVSFSCFCDAVERKTLLILNRWKISALPFLFSYAYQSSAQPEKLLPAQNGTPETPRFPSPLPPYSSGLWCLIQFGGGVPLILANVCLVTGVRQRKTRPTPIANTLEKGQTSSSS